METLTSKITQILEASFPEAQVNVGPMRGASDDHLEIKVSSTIFEGLGLLEQHQKVMDVLKKEFNQDLHAVRIKTSTPTKE